MIKLTEIGGDFWRPVSASKNSVPGGRARARNPTALEAAIPRLRRGDSGALRSRAQPPKGGRIAQSLDTDAAGQAAFHSCFDKIWSEEGERDGHIDLPNAT